MPFDAAALLQASQVPGYEEAPPPSDYEASLVEAEMFESKAGDEFLRLRWQVLSGPQRDHVWSHVQSLEPKNRNGDENPALVVTARILEAVGVDIPTVVAGGKPALRTELDNKAVGKPYLVEVRQNGQYRNTMPKQRLEAVQQSMSTGPVPSPPPGPRPQNAITGDIGLPMSTQDVRRDIERTGESDVPGAQDDEFQQPPQQGAIDPETGDPIPF